MTALEDYEPPPEIAAELDAWDLQYAESVVPALWRFVRTYFRAEVRGFDRVPGDEPVLFVGNHSGGFGSPDSAVFILGYFQHHGEVRPIYWLAHELVMNLPVLGDVLRACGAVTGSREVAKAALARGADLVVYPGGEIEMHRPWSARYEIRFHGRTGWLDIAHEAGVRVVPVVGCGGHNTYFSITDGERIARALRLDELFRLKTFPVALSVPWGLDVGGVLPHLPLPAKITIEVLDPIDVGQFYDSEAAYDVVTSRMQATLDRLAEER